uniref:Uncharacterized protein n=1 Tax=Arundo donax TaxID=35708 RepID=A0A0A9B0S4_ARUDO
MVLGNVNQAITNEFHDSDIGTWNVNQAIADEPRSDKHALLENIENKLHKEWSRSNLDDNCML